MRFRGCRSWSSLRAESRDSADSVPAGDCTADPNFWASVWNLQAIEKTAAAGSSTTPTAGYNSRYMVGGSEGSRGSTSSSTTPGTSDAPQTNMIAAAPGQFPIERSPVIHQPPAQQVPIQQSLITPKAASPNGIVQPVVQCRQPLPGPPLVLGGGRRAILTKSISVDSRLTSQRVVPISGPCITTGFNNQTNGLANSVVINPVPPSCPPDGSTVSNSSASTPGSLISLSPPLASIVSEKHSIEDSTHLLKSPSPTSSLMRVTALECSVPDRPLRSALKSGRSFECHTTIDNRANRRGATHGTRTVIKSVSYDATVELDDGCTTALKFDANRNHINMTNKNNNNNSVVAAGHHHYESTTPWGTSAHSTGSLNGNKTPSMGSGIVFNGTYPIDEPITGGLLGQSKGGVVSSAGDSSRTSFEFYSVPVTPH